MEIKGKVHCFFEQSGTFKREFIKLGIPATIKEVVAHFKDEHTEKMTLMDLLVLKPRVKNQITKIDCYEENEISNLSI